MLLVATGVRVVDSIIQIFLLVTAKTDKFWQNGVSIYKIEVSDFNNVSYLLWDRFADCSGLDRFL